MNNHQVGVDVGGTSMLMLAEHEGKYIEEKVPTGADCTKEYVKEQLDTFINGLPFEVTAVGMALPGLVENNNTMPLSDVLPNLNGVTTDYFSDGRFQMKFMNDVNAATLAEAIHHDDKHTVAVVMVGTGMAAGVTIEGELLVGSQGFAGEVGWAHIPYEDGVERFDNLVAGGPILEKARNSAEEFVKRLDARDEEATQIVEEAAYYFGVCLGQIIQFYNPDVIVVGGSTSTYPNYMEIAKKTAKECTLPEMYNHCSIIEPQDMERIVALWGLLNEDWD